MFNFVSVNIQKKLCLVNFLFNLRQHDVSKCVLYKYFLFCVCLIFPLNTYISVRTMIRIHIIRVLVHYILAEQVLYY